MWVEVRSTTSFRLKLDAPGGQVLRRQPQDANGGPDERIPFAVYLDGARVEGANAYVDRDRQGTRGAVARLPLHIVVGDAAGKRAGRYRGEITLTIEPRGL